MPLSPLQMLVIDDEESVQRSFKLMFESGVDVFSAGSGAEAVSILQKVDIDLIFLDIGLPDQDGFSVLEKIKVLDADIPVVMITADKNTKSTVKAMKMGALDYLVKPFNIDEVQLIVDRIMHERMKERELAFLRNEVKEIVDDYTIIGKNKKILVVLDLIEKVSRSRSSTVLITGESGVGKELVARAVHTKGAGVQDPFVAVNCSALPQELIESELFGHEKGAFTGAHEKKKGKFEIAGMGTIFLDEIATMSEPLQSKLLRVLQEREFERVGSSRAIPLHARIIAATNVDLKRYIKQGRFREDLFHRLNVVHIDVPPLRERKDDIPVLVRYFIAKFRKRIHSQVENISSDACQVFQSYHWPGNVRELANVIERLMLITDEPCITSRHIPIEILMSKRVSTRQVTVPAAETLKEEYASFERDIIVEVLENANYNQVKAAQLLNVHRNTLRLKIQDYRIDVHSLRARHRDHGKRRS